ncbi:hypothetical protein HDV57DRAFT_503705 [Trichoderma longibrachiatum]
MCRLLCPPLLVDKTPICPGFDVCWILTSRTGEVLRGLYRAQKATGKLAWGVCVCGCWVVVWRQGLCGSMRLRLSLLRQTAFCFSSFCLHQLGKRCVRLYRAHMATVKLRRGVSARSCGGGAVTAEILGLSPAFFSLADRIFSFSSSCFRQFGKRCVRLYRAHKATEKWTEKPNDASRWRCCYATCQR